MYEQPNRTEHPDQTDLTGFGEAPFVGKNEIGPGDKLAAKITGINKTGKGVFRANLHLQGFGDRVMDLSASNQQKIVQLFGNPSLAIGRSVYIEGRNGKDRSGRDIVQRFIIGVA